MPPYFPTSSPSETATTALVVAGLILMGFGTMFCFFGVRFYRFTLFVTGLGFGYGFFGALTGLPNAGFVAGLVCALIAVFSVPFGSFICGMSCPFLFLILLVPGSSQATAIFMLVVSIFTGIFGVYRRRLTILFFSALAGGIYFTTGMLLIVISSGDSMDIPGSVLTLITFILAGIGIAVQSSNSKNVYLDRFRPPPPVQYVHPSYQNQQGQVMYGSQAGYGNPQQHPGTVYPVQSGSIPFDPSYIGQTCPYCQTPIKPGANIVVCSACGMPHHAECWHANGQCTTYGCEGNYLNVMPGP